MMIAPQQLRAARSLLRLEQDELARRAHVSVVTIRRIEAASSETRVAPTTLDQVRQALEQAGAEFIPGGVRQRTHPRPDADALFDTLRTISLRGAESLDAHQLTEADLYDEDGLPA